MVGIFIAIAVIVLALIAFIALIGLLLALGMREKDVCYYDPEVKEWIPFIFLTEEQLSRIVPNKRKLRKKAKSEFKSY